MMLSLEMLPQEASTHSIMLDLLFFFLVTLLVFTFDLHNINIHCFAF